MSIYQASTIAKWFIDWANAEDAGLSNLKLQKLLYYAQGHHLATRGTRLFSDTIQAWSDGPVVADIYHEYKSHGSEAIVLSDDDTFDWGEVDPDTTAFLNKIWNTNGGIAAWKLRNMTHAEPPWKDSFEPGSRDVEIATDDIRRYFAAHHG